MKIGKKNNSLNLLSLVSNYLNQDVLIINSNVLFRSNLIKSALNYKSSFVISNNKNFNLDDSIIFIKKNNLTVFKKSIKN